MFQNENDHHELIITYNITGDYDFGGADARDTISLHRKKQTNTLYTINAINTIIRQKNNGVLDKTFPIAWDEYRNSLLLTNENELNAIPTRIYSIVDIETWEKDRKI